MRHILSILVENESGALSRIAGLFSARGYNIESLTVAPTEDVTMSRMTIVTVGSDDVIEQITKQLNKLVDVVKVVDLTEGNHIERELMLVKVRAAGKDREEMKRLADIFRGNILDVTDKSYTIELTGTGAKLDAFIQSIEPGVILETVRTGIVGVGHHIALVHAAKLCQAAQLGQMLGWAAVFDFFQVVPVHHDDRLRCLSNPRNHEGHDQGAFRLKMVPETLHGFSGILHYVPGKLAA